MKKITALLLCTGLALSCSSAPQSISLFNGEDLSGWHMDVPAMDDDP